MSECVIVRRARPDELEKIGQLTLASYLADGMVNPDGAYAMELVDAPRRARDAELLVAVDSEDTLLGTVTICAPGSPLGELSRPGELEFRMLAVAPGARRRGCAPLRRCMSRTGSMPGWDLPGCLSWIGARCRGTHCWLSAKRRGLRNLEVLGAAIQLDVDPRIDFDVAAGLYRATREAGNPVRSLMDCLIAAVAVRTGAAVVHQDRDFDVLAAVAADLTCIRELI